MREEMTIAVLGLVRTGTAVTPRLKAQRMEVVGSNRSPESMRELAAQRVAALSSAREAIHARKCEAAIPPRSGSQQPRDFVPHFTKQEIAQNVFSIGSNRLALWQRAMTRSMVGIERSSPPRPS